MNRKGSSGVSQKDHLAQVAKVKGRMPPEMIPPEFPDVASHVWETFVQLHNGRTVGMGSPNPISWEAIQAWCNLTGIVLSPWEIETVKELDMLWLRISAKDNS
jgi:hypothetical protein